MSELSEAEALEAQRALSDLSERRIELRRACEAAVVEWQWAAESSSLHRPQPLYRERHGLGPPKLLDKPPLSPRHEQQYGLDANGEITVAREYVGPSAFREELRVRRGDVVAGYRWMETGEPAEVNIAWYANGRIRPRTTRRDGSSSSESTAIVMRRSFTALPTRCRRWRSCTGWSKIASSSCCRP